jgi:hypothetical protein
MIRIGRRLPTDSVIGWLARMRIQRRDVPIGAVLDERDPSIASLLSHGIQFMPVIDKHELEDDRLPPGVLKQVFDLAVDGRILRDWRTRWNLAGC